MELNKYLINAKSSWGCNNKIVMLAINKKEALKFCKDFDGLKVIERVKGKSNVTICDSIDEIMQKQKEILQKGLANKTIIIEE